jgi:hypothetical protein
MFLIFRLQSAGYPPGNIISNAQLSHTICEDFHNVLACFWHFCNPCSSLSIYLNPTKTSNSSYKLFEFRSGRVYVFLSVLSPVEKFL